MAHHPPRGTVKVPDKNKGAKTKNQPAPQSATWWDLYGNDPAAIDDYYFVSGLGNPQTVTRVRGGNGHILVGSPSTGWYDPRAPYGRDRNGKAIIPHSTAKPTVRSALNSPGLHKGPPKRGRPAEAYTHQQIVQGFLGSADPSNVQHLLKRGGFYGTADPVYGQISTDDGDAMSKGYQAYQESHKVGQSFQDWLTTRADAADAQGTYAVPTPQRVPLTVALTDPKSIEAAVNSPTSGSDAGSSNASQAIGRFFTPQELQGYINQIHNGERVTQTAADNASPSYQLVGPGAAPLPTGGTVVGGPGAPSAPTAQEIDLAAKAAHPAEYAATHMGEQASRIYQILGQHMAGGVTAS